MLSTAGTERLNIGSTGMATFANGVTVTAAWSWCCSQSNASGELSSSNGTNGQLLLGGGAAPTWANLTSTGGTIAYTVDQIRST